MIDFSFYDPPIEVAAASPRLEMIVSRLKASGLRPYLATDLPDFTASDPLLIDLQSASPQILDRLKRAAMMDAPRQIVLLDSAPSAAGTSLPAMQDTIHLRQDRDLTTLKSRLAALDRRALRQREAAIRHESARELGAKLPGLDLDAVPALLYLGSSSPLFLSLQHTLRQRGVDITAAISRQTARQHIMGKRFAAALVDISTQAHDPGGLNHWISEEDGLSGLPLIVISRLDKDFTERQLALLSHAAEILDPATPQEEMVTRIETQCRRLHAAAPMMPLPGLAQSVTDLTSGLFSRAFFEAHLPRQMALSTDHAESLSVLTLRLDPPAAKSVTDQKIAGDTILRQIRDTDCAALIQPGVIAISLPATPYRGGVRLAERIDEALVRSGMEHPGLSWRVTEKRSYHTPRMLLAASLIGPFIRTRLAA